MKGKLLSGTSYKAIYNFLEEKGLYRRSIDPKMLPRFGLLEHWLEVDYKEGITAILKKFGKPNDRRGTRGRQGEILIYIAKYSLNSNKLKNLSGRISLEKGKLVEETIIEGVYTWKNPNPAESCGE